MPLRKLCLLADHHRVRVRAEKPHPESIERLPLHVDDAAEPEAGAHGGGGHAVLAGACRAAWRC
jgi:hypothetical protein